MAELPPPAPAAGRPWLLRAGILLLCVGLFGCDHATKIAAHAALAGGRVVPIYDGIVELKYQPNPDTAFSLLERFGVDPSKPLLLAVSMVALLGVFAAWIASRRRATLTQHVGFAIVAAGALGNVVDRAMRGFVVDFIHVTRWPIFNVADIAVVVGAGLLAIVAARARGAPAAQGASPPPPSRD